MKTADVLAVVKRLSSVVLKNEIETLEQNTVAGKQYGNRNGQIKFCEIFVYSFFPSSLAHFNFLLLLERWYLCQLFSSEVLLLLANILNPDF